MSNQNPCQILFIVPNQEWRSFAVRALKDERIHAKGVANISEALRLFKILMGHQLVFLDFGVTVRLPDQVERLTKNTQRRVVVLFAGSLSPHEMSRMFKRGAYDCVGKPYDAQSLIRLVKGLLQEVFPSSPGELSCVFSNIFSSA